MEEKNLRGQEAADEIYKYASQLLFTQQKSPEQTRDLLIKKGLTEPNANLVISTLLAQKHEPGQTRALKDMIYGALLGIAGGFATVSNYITGCEEVHIILSYTAIITGSLLFFKGLANRV